MVFASGAPRDRLVVAMLDEAQRRPPNIPSPPEGFQHLRSEQGAQVYGSMGIAREDKAARAVARLRNWEFFRAPLVGIVCMHHDLGPADAVSVGMFLQTLLLALTERGLGSCVEVSVAWYPEIIRAQLAIPAELSMRPGGRLPRPRLPRQSAAHRPRAHRGERGVPRQLTRGRIRKTGERSSRGGALLDMIGWIVRIVMFITGSWLATLAILI
jgi:hypothetical protein